MMDIGGGHHADSAVPVMVVVPVEESPAESAGVLDRPEALRKVGAVFDGLEVCLAAR
jgi:hypothetical protein